MFRKMLSGKSPVPLMAAIGAMLLLSSVEAKAACYEEVHGDPVMSCTGGIAGNSADFASNCTYTPGPVTTVEVDCPGMWVNTTDGSQAETCASVGLNPGNISGQICAAGERRPTEGLNAGGINYRFGKWGGGNRGGSSSVLTDTPGGTRHCGGKEGGECTYPPVHRWDCWNPGDKRDMDSTDRTVAYYCQP